MLPKNLKNRLFSDVSLRTLRYVHPVPPAEATGLLREVYAQITGEFLLGGPLVVHSQVPILMAGMWTFGRETNLVETDLDRISKEAIAAAVAVTNRCTYCVDMHVSMTHAGERHEVAAAIRLGDRTRVYDPYWAAVIDWSLASLTPSAEILRNPPFSAEQLPEAIGNAVFFHYTNRVVNVLFDGAPMGEGGGFAKGLMLRAFGSELSGQVKRALKPGLSLDLLPHAELPEAFAWAEGQPVVADAVARWSASLEQDTDRSVPTAIKDAVDEVLADWNGQEAPLSRVWVEPYVQRATPKDQPVLRLALLTALDSHRVMDADVQPILERADEATLIRVVAWSAFAAARRIGRWLTPELQISK